MSTLIRLKQIESGSELLNSLSGSATNISVSDEGSILGSVKTLDFIGAGVSVSVNNQTASVNVAGGNASLSGEQYRVGVYDTTNTLSTGSIYDSGSFTAIGATEPVDPTVPDRLFVNAGVTDSYNGISTHGTIDNYFQTNIQNFSNGGNASSDIVATADNGNESTNYIDMGINNSGYNQVDGIGYANDAYVYTTGGDLYLGNLNSGKNVVIFNGTGSTDTTARVFVTDFGSVGINTVDINPTNPEILLVSNKNSSQQDYSNIIVGKTTVNENYAQLNIQNQGSGSLASSDIVATNDIGTETSYYIDMGINSSNYDTPNQVGMANDAYLYSTGEHLHIGNATNNPVMIFAGGLDVEANRKVVISPDNQHELTGSISISGSQILNGQLTINSVGTHNISGIISSSDAIHVEKNTGDLAFNTKGRILYSNYFDTYEELTGSVPSTQYHGMFTHVHNGGGRAFFSHGGFGWVQLWDKKNAAGLISGSQIPSYATASLYPTTVSASAAITADSLGANSITISGSTNITASLKLNAVEDPGSGEPLSAFLFVSESLSGGKDLWYRNNGVLYNQSWLQGTLETGLIYGGVVTFTSSVTDTPPFQTELRITPGAGLIVDHNASTSSFNLQTPKYVNFGAITASAQFITSSQVTYLLLDENGQLEQQTTPYTAQQYTNKFPLGYIFCLTTSSITSYADARVTTYAQSEQSAEFVRAFGPLKISGFDITPQSGSLKVSIASGRTYRFGGFYRENPDSPSIYDANAVPTGSLVRVKRDPNAVGGYRAITNAGVPFTDVDPTKWDDGSGTLQTVGSDEWTIQRVFQGVVQGVSYIYYGQNKYSSLALALQAITTDSFAESQTSILALPFIGFVIARGNATDLADSVDNRVIQAGLFRNTAGSSGGGGGAATQNIDDLGDVTITSPTDGQALVYNTGFWINGTPTSSSYAFNSTTASYALNAENVIGIVTSASYAATSSVALNAITASYAQTISKTLVNTIPFIATAGQTIQIKNIGITKDEVGTELRTALNLSQATHCNMTTRVQQGASAYPELYFEYSTDETTWSTLNTNFVDLHNIGTQVTTKETIPSGAKTANTYIRLITDNGTADGSSNATFGNVYLNIFTDV